MHDSLEDKTDSGSCSAMIFDQADQKESQTIEALVPMVDLFAVLAIVFMIYATDEIKITELTTAKKIQEIQAVVDEYENEPTRILEKERQESIEVIKAKRKQKADELVLAFAAMLEAQQEQSADEYEGFVINIEEKAEAMMADQEASLQVQNREALAQAEAALEEEKRQELEREAQAQAAVLAERQAALDAQAAEERRQAQTTAAQQLAQREAELEAQKRQELERAEQAQAAALAERQANLAALAAEEIRQAQVAQERAQAQAEKERAQAQLAEERAQAQAQLAKELGQAEKERAQAQAQAEKERAQAQAEKERAQAQAQLAEERAEAQAQLAKELGQAERERAQAQAQLAKELGQAEKERAQAQAERDRAQAQAERDRAQAQAQAEKERAQAEEKYARELAQAEQELDQQRALTAKAEEDLTPFLKAAEARQQIVDLLNENFSDYDDSAVQIDEKTGKVRLNFQDSYFDRGSHELSEDMKNFLRIMIPKYARSIYENENAAELVESLKISGMTSPVYKGRYIDINDTSPLSEKARQYNMALSNRRAVAMYDFIFDESEMGNYQYRTRLKRDMGISALGFQNAQPVRTDLVGKDADCIEYNCKKEQATILQFRLYTEELASN